MTDKDLHAGISELVNTALSQGVTLDEAVGVLARILGKTQLALSIQICESINKSNVPD